MSSTNKTPNLRLNSWLGSDIPSRTDFVNDNAIIDNALGSHMQNSIAHITADERSTWNSPYYIGSYMGNGSVNRSISLNIGFTPTWGFVFSVGNVPSVHDYNNKASYNYFALVSDRGATQGASLSGSTLNVVQSSVAVEQTEYRNLNENGVTYIYILFR